MTLSLVALDAKTGAFGMVVASSSPAVAARCVHLRAGTGAVASQNVTNPALGGRVLAILGSGAPAAEALRRACAADPAPEYRQVTVVDAAGRTAFHNGARTLGKFAASAGDGVVAAGNLLASIGVVDAMLSAYGAAEAAALEDRLLAALLAGLRAGGEAGPVRSAGLAVVEDVSWPVTDLRVDDHDDPAAELARLWGLWRKQKADYVRRALSPAAAPAFGVPGDPR
jgi:uncharacterized Ntn-hydrolase superfamily protein